MTTTDADTILKNDPVPQELLDSNAIARLAYVWTDGTPRVVPMWFHWTGAEILMGAPPNSPKMRALAERPHVALTIDTNDYPHQVLSIRGVATVKVLEGFFPEYEAMAHRYLGETGGQQAIAMMGQIFTHWCRIAIRPEAVRILDFETRFPSAWPVAAG